MDHLHTPKGFTQTILRQQCDIACCLFYIIIYLYLHHCHVDFFSGELFESAEEKKIQIMSNISKLKRILFLIKGFRVKYFMSTIFLDK